MLKFAQDIKVFLDSLPQKFCFSATPCYTIRGNIWFYVVVAKDFLSVCTQCPRSYKKDSEDSLSHRPRSAERERNPLLMCLRGSVQAQHTSHWFSQRWGGGGRR